MPLTTFQNRMTVHASNGLWPGAPKDPHFLPGGIGPIWLYALFDFTASGSSGGAIADNLLLDIEGGRLGSVQTVYIDNSGLNDGVAPSAFNLQFGNSFQLIAVQPKFIAILPVITPDTVSFTARSAAATNKVPVYFGNMPMAPVVWQAVP